MSEAVAGELSLLASGSHLRIVQSRCKPGPGFLLLVHSRKDFPVRPQAQAGCYGPSVCVPPKSTEQHTKAQSNGVRRRGLRDLLDPEGGALMMRSVSLGEETGRLDFTLSTLPRSDTMRRQPRASQEHALGTTSAFASILNIYLSVCLVCKPRTAWRFVTVLRADSDTGKEKVVSQGRGLSSHVTHLRLRGLAGSNPVCSTSD